MVGESSPPSGGILRTGESTAEPRDVTFSDVPEVREFDVDQPVPPVVLDTIPAGPTFLQGLFARVFAGTKDSMAVGLVQSVYAGPMDEEGGSDTKFSMGFWSTVKAKILGSHDERHRTIRRVAVLIRRLRPLLDTMRAEVPERELRDTSVLGVAYVENAVRRILRKAVEDGEVAERQRATFQRLLVKLAPLSVDEDDFADLVGRVVRSAGRGY